MCRTLPPTGRCAAGKLGIVDGGEAEKGFAWKNHDRAEWRIGGLDHDGVMLYREQAVTEFPAGLESEYP